MKCKLPKQDRYYILFGPDLSRGIRFPLEFTVCGNVRTASGRGIGISTLLENTHFAGLLHAERLRGALPLSSPEHRLVSTIHVDVAHSNLMTLYSVRMLTRLYKTLSNAKAATSGTILSPPPTPVYGRSRENADSDV